ncbi:MAG TPA: SUF system NifU family Fe-S cluster assembly protein [Vicinamibacterales bacterium]|nr:SUF system NifU family Fe-S cluster assembly protein [Vicinamibacterales bacterium]
MSSDVEALYQRIILDHNRNPRNFRAVAGGRSAEGHNPLCGDQLTVHVCVEGSVVTDAGFLGSGCAIATASASLMTESVKGLEIGAFHALAERFERLVAGPAGSPAEDLGALTAFAGVRRFPLRAKCALLAWRTLAAAIDASGGNVSTE